jgi:hypothetical protein
MFGYQKETLEVSFFYANVLSSGDQQPL